MKITNVEGIILRLPVRQAVADGTQDDLLIRIETDEGIVGYGEVDTSPEVGKAAIDAQMSHGTCYGLQGSPDRPRSIRYRADMGTDVSQDQLLRTAWVGHACHQRY